MNTNRVAIVRCPNYSEENLDLSINRIFSLFGGPKSIIKPNQRVLLKPNLIASHKAEEAATTHPAVIESLIKIIKECEAFPSIGDSPAFGSARGVAQCCGIGEVAARHNVPIVEFKRNSHFSRFSWRFSPYSGH